MGILRLVHIPLIIFMVAIAPIVCPCCDVVVTLKAATTRQHSARCSSWTGGLRATRAPVYPRTTFCGVSQGAASGPTCLYRILKGVLRDSTNAAQHTCIARLDLTHLYAVMPMHRPAMTHLGLLNKCAFNSAANSLLRQHCALII